MGQAMAMPWEVSDVMDQRYQCVELWRDDGESVTELAARKKTPPIPVTRSMRAILLRGPLSAGTRRARRELRLAL